MCEVILALDCGGSSIKAAVICEKDILEKYVENEEN